MECSAGIPLSGGIKTTINVSSELGLSKEWSNSSTHEISSIAVLNPKSSGVYKVSGWVEIADNIELNFRAKASISAKGIRVNKEER